MVYIVYPDPNPDLNPDLNPNLTLTLTLLPHFIGWWYPIYVIIPLYCRYLLYHKDTNSDQLGHAASLSGRDKFPDEYREEEDGGDGQLTTYVRYDISSDVIISTSGSNNGNSGSSRQDLLRDIRNYQLDGGASVHEMSEGGVSLYNDDSRGSDIIVIDSDEEEVNDTLLTSHCGNQEEKSIDEERSVSDSSDGGGGFFVEEEVTEEGKVLR